MKFNPMIENYYQEYFQDGKVNVEKIARNISTIQPNVLTRLNFYINLEILEKLEKKGKKQTSQEGKDE